MDGFSIGDTVPLNLSNADEFGFCNFSVRNRATGKYVDFADNIFKAAGTAATQFQSGTVQGDEWLYLWDTTGLNDGGVLTGKQSLAIEFDCGESLACEYLNLGYGGGGGGASAADIWSYGTRELTALSTAQVAAITTSDIQAMDAAGFLKAITPANNSVDVDGTGAVLAQAITVDDAAIAAAVVASLPNLATPTNIIQAEEVKNVKFNVGGQVLNQGDKKGGFFGTK